MSTIVKILKLPFLHLNRAKAEGGPMLNLNAPVQESLFKEHASPERRRVVNVASVKQRSPFRYPGGKTHIPSILVVTP